MASLDPSTFQPPGDLHIRVCGATVPCRGTAWHCCAVSLGKDRLPGYCKTREMKHTGEPMWSEEFVIELQHINATAALEVELWRSTFLGSRTVGSSKVPLTELPRALQQPRNFTLPMVRSGSAAVAPDATTPTVTVELWWSASQAQPQQPPQGAGGSRQQLQPLMAVATQLAHHSFMPPSGSDAARQLPQIVHKKTTTLYEEPCFTLIKLCVRRVAVGDSFKPHSSPGNSRGASPHKKRPPSKASSSSMTVAAGEPYAVLSGAAASLSTSSNSAVARDEPLSVAVAGWAVPANPPPKKAEVSGVMCRLTFGKGQKHVLQPAALDANGVAVIEQSVVFSSKRPLKAKQLVIEVARVSGNTEEVISRTPVSVIELLMASAPLAAGYDGWLAARQSSLPAVQVRLADSYGGHVQGGYVQLTAHVADTDPRAAMFNVAPLTASALEVAATAAAAATAVDGNTDADAEAVEPPSGAVAPAGAEGGFASRYREIRRRAAAQLQRQRDQTPSPRASSKASSSGRASASATASAAAATASNFIWGRSTPAAGGGGTLRGLAKQLSAGSLGFEMYRQLQAEQQQQGQPEVPASLSVSPGPLLAPLATLVLTVESVALADVRSESFLVLRCGPYWVQLTNKAVAVASGVAYYSQPTRVDLPLQLEVPVFGPGPILTFLLYKRTGLNGVSVLGRTRYRLNNLIHLSRHTHHATVNLLVSQPDTAGRRYPVADITVALRCSIPSLSQLLASYLRSPRSPGYHALALDACSSPEELHAVYTAKVAKWLSRAEPGVPQAAVTQALESGRQTFNIGRTKMHYQRIVNQLTMQWIPPTALELQTWAFPGYNLGLLAAVYVCAFHTTRLLLLLAAAAALLAASALLHELSNAFMGVAVGEELAYDDVADVDGDSPADDAAVASSSGRQQEPDISTRSGFVQSLVARYSNVMRIALQVQNGMDNVATVMERLNALMLGLDPVASAIMYTAVLSMCVFVCKYGLGALLFWGTAWWLRPPLLRIVPHTIGPVPYFVHVLQGRQNRYW